MIKPQTNKIKVENILKNVNHTETSQFYMMFFLADWLGFGVWSFFP